MSIFRLFRIHLSFCSLASTYFKIVQNVYHQQHSCAILQISPLIRKLSSGSYSYLHIDLSFFCELTSFHTLWLEKSNHGLYVILISYILLMDPPCSSTHVTALSLPRRLLKPTKRNWELFVLLPSAISFSAANNNNCFFNFPFVSICTHTNFPNSSRSHSCSDLWVRQQVPNSWGGVYLKVSLLTYMLYIIFLYLLFQYSGTSACRFL